MIAASTRLGPYEIMALLGAGGMGEVYRARDTRLDRAVAVKVLPPQFAQDPVRLARFEREAKAVAALSHPNILAIHDVGVEQGVTFLVTELLEGESLRQRLVGPVSNRPASEAGSKPASTSLPWRKAVEIGIAIADGLAAAHAKGVIHRDIKPDNVFLTADERVKILDFGLARIDTGPPTPLIETQSYTPEPTRPGAVMGTPPYMSPEQLRGQPVDARSDIFSLGCVLYEMVAGRRAFAANTDAELSAAILHDDPPELAASGKKTPPEFERIIRHCLEKKPEARFHSAHDVAFALRAVLSDSRTQRTSLATSRARTIIGITAALVLAAMVGIGLYLRFKDGKSPELNPPAAPSKAINSLAVLPFANQSKDPEADFLADGLTQSLSDGLRRLPGLTVLPYTSTMRFKPAEIDLVTAGQKLQVRAVLTGTVRKQGDEVQVFVELSDVQGKHPIAVWSKPYPRKYSGFLALQGEIARDVTDKLRLELTGEQQKQIAQLPTTNLEAFRLYTLGRHHWHQFTEEGLQKAIGYFEQALEKDPRYAMAYVGLGESYNVLGINFRPPKENLPKAKKYLEKALDLNPDLAEAHEALGSNLMWSERNWLAAEKELLLAIKLNPRSPGAHHLYAFYLLAMRRPLEAVGELRKAKELDPQAPIRSNDLGAALTFARQYDQALAEFQKTHEISPGFPVTYAFMGLAYAQQEKFDEAITTLQTARAILKDNPKVLGILGYTYAGWEKKDEANKVLEELKARAKSRFAPGYEIEMARIYAGLGETERAFDWLRKAYDAGSPWLGINLTVDPSFKDLHTDKRFADLVRDLGLPGKDTRLTPGANNRFQSVAILPLLNTGDPAGEPLCEGIAEHLTGSLVQVRDRRLVVRSFNSTSHYKGQKADPQTAGRALVVEALVVGRLRQEGNELTVNLDLVDVRNQDTKWSKPYQGMLSEILLLQDDIARDLAAELGLRLTTEQEKALTRRYTTDHQAWRLFVEGRRQWDLWTEEGLESSIKHFQRAIDRDPKFALALAWQAHGNNVLGHVFRSAKEYYPRGKQLADQALGIDDKLAEGYSARGAVLLFYERDFPAAEKAFQQALSIEPKNSIARMLSYLLHSVRGNMQKAIAEAEQLVRDEPTWGLAHWDLATMYTGARRFQEAETHARRAIALKAAPGHTALGEALCHNNQPQAAIDSFHQGLAILKDDPYMLGLLGYTYAKAGKPEEAQGILKRLQALPIDRPQRAYGLATVHAGLGDKAQAFAWLRKSYDNRDQKLVFLKVELHWQSLRDDPRFTQLLKDMGLPP